MSAPAMADVNDIKIDNLPTMRDPRGNLVVAEFNKYLPFPVVRLFYVYGVPANTTRGNHAHHRLRQYLICQTGRVLISTADGMRTRQIELHPGQAVLIGQGIFASETYLDSDSVLLVLCDRPYEEDDYIRTMEEFLQHVAER
jgi:dTDP-4-dehydrorhamnose 3,5-epimerase-like enzyme